jgi:hypothetical protein
MQLGESGCVMLALSTAIDIYIGGRHVKITHHSVKSRQKLEAFSNMVHPHAEAAFWTWLGGWGGCGSPSKTLHIANLPKSWICDDGIKSGRRKTIKGTFFVCKRIEAAAQRESWSQWARVQESYNSISQKPSFFFLIIFLINKFITFIYLFIF